jgi:hypothetical protein
MQVDKVARASSQAKVLQLLCHNGDDTPAGSQTDHSNAAALTMHPAQPPSAAAWALGGIWGLGTANTVQAFEELCGVNFKERSLQQRACYGGQDPGMFVDLMLHH